MPHHVCHLIDANLDTSYFRSIARYHDREQFPATIGSIAPSGPLQAAMHSLGLPTFSLGAKSRRQYAGALVRLVRWIRHREVHLLHAHCFDPTCLGLVAARIARIPFIFTRHHSDHHIRINRHWHTRVDGWTGRQADHVIAVSEVTRRIMIEVEHVPGDRITVVYNGMEPLREPRAEERARLRSELGWRGEPVCLILARLHEEKGHRYLFAAIPEVLRRAGATTFLLAGDGPHRRELESAVRERGLEGVVRFLGRRDDVPALIDLASVVVLPSLAESFGFVLLEAMSLGKPVVASEIGGIPEVVSDGETGLLVPSADPHALADAIARVLLNPEVASTLGRAGRARAGCFGFDRMMRSYESIYRRVLGSSGGSTTQRGNGVEEFPHPVGAGHDAR